MKRAFLSVALIALVAVLLSVARNIGSIDLAYVAGIVVSVGAVRICVSR